MIDIINKSKVPNDKILEFLKVFDEILDMFCKEWNIEKPFIKFLPSWPIYEKIKVTLIDSKEERAFHGCRKDPYAFILVDNNFSRLLSHEIFELLINPDMKQHFELDGIIYQKEVCDPVFENTIHLSGIEFSDWVLPSWFEKESKGPYNHLNTLLKPFEIDKGGYIEKVS